MSNAYPRPDDDGPLWPDLSRRSRPDDRAASPRDVGQQTGDDRSLWAVTPARDGRPPADPRTSWPDEPPARVERDRRGTSYAPDAVAPQPPPPVAADRAVPTPDPPRHAGRSDAPEPAPEPRGGRTAPSADADAPSRRAPDEIEETVPAGQRLRAAGARLSATVRASVPVRTALFVLPPLVLPALAFDLSPAAALVASVLLLWLAAAAGVMATMMFEGSDQLALRAIERRLDHRQTTARTTDDEALLAVGAQLDALNDRLDELTAARSSGPAGGHRPQEQWSTSVEEAQNDRYDHDVVSGRHWSQPRWER